MGLLVSFVIPMCLLFVGVLGKKIVRGKGWRVRDWYLGVESSLAALTSGIINLFDLLAKVPDNAPLSKELKRGFTWTGIFVFFAFVLFLFVLSTHQDHETKGSAKPNARTIWWLAIFCNIIGLGLLACFLLWIKS